MHTKIRVLIAEDSAEDAELLVLNLRRAGYEPDWHRVDTEADYLAHLHGGLDLVLSDYNMPQFNGMRALELLNESGLEVPFIIISGTIGEEMAVAAMRLGAADYLLKDRMARLGPAISHALDQSRLQRERRRAESELRASEERFRQLAENISEAFWMTDPVTRAILYISPVYEKIWGRTCESLYAKPGNWQEAIHPEDQARVFEASQKQTQGGYDERYRILRPDGSLRWIRDRAFPVRNEKGEIFRIVGTAEDVSGQKRSELRSEVQHAATEVLSEAAPLGETARRILELICRHLDWDLGSLWALDRRTKKLRCVETWHQPQNELSTFANASRMMSFVTGEGQPGRVLSVREPQWISDITQAETETFCRRLEAIELGLRGSLAFPIKLKSEILGVVEFFSTRPRPTDVAMLSMFANLGTQIGQFIERKQLEEQFLQAQKMEAIGTLAGGIAHDFNNVLAAITGYTELARTESLDRPEVLEYLQAIAEGSGRATHLVRQILAFSRQEQQQRVPLLLGPLLDEVLKLLRATIPSSIQINTSLVGQARKILGDPTQIHQIIMNLVTNAAHAMKVRPGQLSVSLENIEVGEELAALNPELRPIPYMRLSVSDTGHGMDEATLGRIFEPFFTTKAPGEGTGLGLSVVHGIMQSHDGAITVYSHPGDGTRFQLYFPVIPDEAWEPVIPQQDVPRGHGEHILFLDDEVSLAVMGKKILERLGYVVDAHSVPAEALAAIRLAPEKYSLAITDQTMPGMMGTEVAEQLRKIRPDLPIILTTGYSATLTPARARAAGISEMILKPLSLKELGEIVHRVLSSPKH